MTKYDMGQASLVHLIREYYALFDKQAIGMLRNLGKGIADYSELGIEELEGEGHEIQPGIVALAACPFTDTIESFESCCNTLPEEITILADEANELGGAWVSAFCGIHQGMRRGKVGESFQQIACKSSTGAVNIADQDLLSKEEVDELMDKYVCLYGR
ncbi:MAG: hypothetical protein DWQ07_23670 [Chloroflexi bacterium]|nr:MAG: hypothetical protein DWQ07_23670 [Chloroflexota bacterium]MBL1194148.1 hypothetical protein [Chloroflexota bacterium]NOH11441.1 hypothetical protein [Chloroflexota bacterium]